jgi:hypothetical protein
LEEQEQLQTGPSQFVEQKGHKMWGKWFKEWGEPQAMMI